MPARSTLSVRGPSSPIVKLASARSRRSALLRPHCARLTALTAPSANLMRQLSTAHTNSVLIDTHGIREPLDDAHRRRYCEVIFCRLRIATPSTSPDAEHTNRRPQVTVRLFSRHTPWLLIRVTIHQRITQSRRISLWPKVTVRDLATRRSRTYSTRTARPSPIFSRKSSRCHGHPPVSCRCARSRTQCCPTTAERVR